MNFLIFINVCVVLSSIGLVFGAFYGSNSDDGNGVLVCDPSIFSTKTIVDTWVDSWFPKKLEPIVFNENDYELKDLLRATAELGYWDLFENMLEIDVKRWEYIPDIDEVIEAIVTGPSEIIFDLFMSDERIKEDSRILKAEKIFFYHRNQLQRLARAFDSNLFGVCEDYSRAEEIFRINAPLPLSFYIQSMPSQETISSNVCDASKFMIFFAFNRFIPKNALEYFVNRTEIPLGAVPFDFIVPTTMKVSLHALADIAGNSVFRSVLMDTSRYGPEIARTNTRMDEICKKIILERMTSDTLERTLIN